jgi:hypothetical protein
MKSFKFFQKEKVPSSLPTAISVASRMIADELVPVQPMSAPLYGQSPTIVEVTDYRPPILNRWVGSERGVPRWIGQPTGSLFYLDYTDGNQEDRLQMSIRSKHIVVSTFHHDSYQSFLDQHQNHYIWIYNVASRGGLYMEHNIHDLPRVMEQVTITAHIEFN